MRRRIGVMGGTFNPIHNGHLAVAEEVREKLKLDKILFVPSFVPPHKRRSDMPSAAQRLQMVRIAIAGNDHFEVSTIEIADGDFCAGLRKWTRDEKLEKVEVYVLSNA